MTKSILDAPSPRFYPGLDGYEFPGLPFMQWLKTNSNAVWTSFYLAPAPTHPDSEWMPHRAALAAMGWGFAPIFLGQQTQGRGANLGEVTLAHGTADGLHCAGLMQRAGFPARSYSYLDMENGTPFLRAQRAYVMGWANAMRSAGFMPGAYCSHLLAPMVEEVIGEGARMWVFCVETTQPTSTGWFRFPPSDPAVSGFPRATMHQHADRVTLMPPPAAQRARWLVDLDTATLPDPSAPAHGGFPA